MMNRLMTTVTIGAVLTCLGGGLTTRAQEAALTPKSLQAALEAKPSGAEADRLAARIRDVLRRR